MLGLLRVFWRGFGRPQNQTKTRPRSRQNVTFFGGSNTSSTRVRQERLCHVLRTTNGDLFRTGRERVSWDLNTSWTRFGLGTSCTRVVQVLDKNVFVTFLEPFKDGTRNCKLRYKHVLNTSWTRFGVNLKKGDNYFLRKMNRSCATHLIVLISVYLIHNLYTNMFKPLNSSK